MAVRTQKVESTNHHSHDESAKARSENSKSWEHSTYQEIFAYWRKIIRESSEEEDTFLLFDIDDTLVESLILWVEGMKDVHNQHVVPNVELSDLLNMSDAFEYVRSAVGDEIYRAAEARFRVDEHMNTHGELVHPNLPSLIAALLERHGTLLGGLTVREDRDITRQQTWKKLRSTDLLVGYPVMFRPVKNEYEVDYRDGTRVWKPSVLGKLRGAQKQKNMILIDDNVHTAKGVGEANGYNAPQPYVEQYPVMQILLKTQVNAFGVNELLTAGLPTGVFVAESWEEVEQKVEEAKAWARKRRESMIR